MLPDWIELCNLLNAHNAEYLVVGGQAVIAHGYPRLTKDRNWGLQPRHRNPHEALAMKTPSSVYVLSARSYG